MASLRAVNYLIHKTPVFITIPILSSVSRLSIPVSLIRRYSSQKSVTKSEGGKTNYQLQATLAEKVKKNTVSAWYLTVIVGGLGVTALIFYSIIKELFSNHSPHGVYTMTFTRLSMDDKVRDALGAPIKAYGEETNRGRRGHVKHTIFTKDGVEHMRMKFHLQGSRKRGVVNLEVQENASGDYVYRYLFIEVEDLLKNVIVIEDNRAAFDAQYKNFNNQPILAVS